MLRLARKREKGFTVEEMMTATAIVALLAVLSIPVVSRIMDYAKDQSIIGALRALVEAQRSYRDAQTPTTYANSIEALEGYLELPTSIEFEILTADADSFTIEARKPGGRCFSVNEVGTIGYACSEEGPGDTDPGGGPGDGGGCFLAGTPILLADGRTLPIEEVRVGERVLAFDAETQRFRKDIVKALLVHDLGEHNAKYYLIVNGHLRVTPNHPVYSDGKWIQIGKLKVGDTLLNAEGKPEPIRSVQIVRKHVKVYNLHDVNPYHTFIAGGIVAHNGAACEGIIEICGGGGDKEPM